MQPNLYNIEKSRALLQRSDVTIIRGCQGHKRSHDMLAMGYPVFTRRAAGARFWDVDGNEYLAYLLGFGPILLGYNDPVVNEAVRRQMEEGTIYSTAHPMELEVADMLIDLIPGAEMLGFFIGGSAATSGAVRLARAYTGREAVGPGGPLGRMAVGDQAKRCAIRRFHLFALRPLPARPLPIPPDRSAS